MALAFFFALVVGARAIVPRVSLWRHTAGGGVHEFEGPGGDAAPWGRQIWVCPGFLRANGRVRVWRAICVQTRALLPRI